MTGGIPPTRRRTEARSVRRLSLVMATLLAVVLSVMLGVVLGVGSRGSGWAEGEGARIPSGKALKQLVSAYLDANYLERVSMRAVWDRTLAPLEPAKFKRLRAELLKIASKRGRKLARSGTNYWFDEATHRGKYIVRGKPGRALFIGLHGGGAGAGSAESAAGAMGGGGWWWIFPEVLEKTERGWTDAGTEAWVMELIEAAKRSGKVDPNRIYITGHSMGGFGSWTLGAHHADVFAGVAPYAGAPVPEYATAKMQKIKRIQPGILPSFFNLPLHFYQSGDDRNVPPAPNDFAFRALKRLKQRWPDGFDFQYDRVEGRAHAAPKEGYLPSQKWLAAHVRNPRPRAFLWQPVVPWKRQMYWIYWPRAEDEALLEFRATADNTIDITTHEGSSGDVSGMSVLLGAPLVDLDREVVIRLNGAERFRGKVSRTFSTLMMTLPRGDADLLFDARVDL